MVIYPNKTCPPEELHTNSIIPNPRITSMLNPAAVLSSRFADRDEMGLKPLSDSTPTAAAEMKKPTRFHLCRVSA